MKRRIVQFIGLALASAFLASCRTPPPPESMVSAAFLGREGSFVLVDCASGDDWTFRARNAAERLPPCSTFKIWNTLIGLETGILSSPDQAFYLWDGVERSFPAWNRDLTLKEAFQASCVPAFQDLARRIGSERMQSWIDKVGYGDRDISAGIDVFWLPAKGRKTVLISPAEQANLIRELVTGRLPFSQGSLSVMRELMFTTRTERGTLYGKTGSGTDGRGIFVLGWFVGYVVTESGTHSFACTVKGENTMGKDARAIVETVLKEKGLL
ncbi:Beta-lactamase [uncultured Desulfatiglans sp.]|nr:Beta-lactamase [uncultured Desulfatiglans sp.]